MIDGAVHLLVLGGVLVQVDQSAETGFALAEEEVADDGTDHRQAGRDLQPGEDRRHRGRVLQLDQAGPTRGAVQRHQLVVALVDAEETEERVGHDREDRDDDADQHAGLEVEADHRADQRNERQDRHGLHAR